MLDIKFIRENVERVKQSVKNKNVDVDIDDLLKIDEKRREIRTKTEKLRAEKNEFSSSLGGKKPSEEQLKKAKEIKENLSGLEEELGEL